MKKDFSKKHHRYAARANNAGQTPWRWIISMAFIAMLFCGGFMAFQYKKNPQAYPFLQAYVSKVTLWVESHRKHLRQDMVKVKRLATNKNSEQEEIHFEFYTALPNMQMNLPSEVQADQSAPVKPMPVATKANASSDTDDVNASSINTDALEQDISAQLNQSRYVLQLGIFRTQDSATRFQKSLTDAGFQSALVKVTATEKKVFRVQIGPFNNKSQARLTQINLEKKGFTGVMRKLDAA